LLTPQHGATIPEGWRGGFVISLARLNFRIILRPGLTPAQRLRLMEVLEKWAVTRAGFKPSRFISSSRMILFVLQVDRDLALATLRECLPQEWVADVVVGGVSWNA
jgi:hypothetical protein